MHRHGIFERRLVRRDEDFERYEPGFEASDLVLTGGSLVISGTGSYLATDGGAGLTAAFSV